MDKDTPCLGLMFFQPNRNCIQMETFFAMKTSNAPPNPREAFRNLGDAANH